MVYVLYGYILVLMARPNKVTRVKVKVIVIEGYILNLQFINIIISIKLMQNYILSKL